jgi:hypothetical protein
MFCSIVRDRAGVHRHFFSNCALPEINAEVVDLDEIRPHLALLAKISYRILA